MKASVLSLLAVAASVSANAHAHSHSNHSTTSTVYTTSVYTITSCAPEVTNCPAKLGSVTTDIISLYTTVCPVTESESTAAPTVPTSTEAPWTTSTVYSTVEYTITSCAPTVTNCPVGSKTTSVITSTTVCPVETPSTAPISSIQPGGPITPTTAPTSPATTAPILSTVTISTCVPTVITSVYTVTAAPTTKPYSTGSPTGGYPVGPKNSTVPFTGGASAQKAGGLLMAVGLAAALL